MKFIHLHLHTHYSLLDGLTKIDHLVIRAKELDMDALAITDHGALYGAVEFYQKAKKAGIKPIIGLEAYVANRTRFHKEAGIDNKRYHLTLLAENNKGYQNLIKLTTAAHLEGYYYKPRVDKDLLKKHADGVIALSGCLGSEIGRAIQSGQMDKAESVAKEYQQIFGHGNYFIEIMHHPEIENFADWRASLVSISKKLNIPLVATQDSHYLHGDDYLAHKTLVAISTNTDVSDTGIFAGSGQYHLISTDEAIEMFKDIPEAVSNTEKIANRCNVNLTLGEFIFPDFALEKNKTADQMLDELTREGMKEKGLVGDGEAEERRRYEIDVIKTKKYSPYFLVVADILRFARESKIYTTVRGSAAGSLVAFLSGITNVNPIEMQLPFERFLNPYRPSAPDIDMDFADNRRAEVIEYAKEKYGKEKVAQIGTFGTMMARGAVRDVARALGRPYEFGDKIAKLIPMGMQGFPMTIDKAMELEPELASFYKRDEEIKQIIDIARKLEGTVRHVSVHAAGVVISPRPLVEYVPIQFDPKDGENLITQYNMYDVGEDGVGLTKLDFLGIRNLAILEDAVRLVAKHRDIKIDIENIPFDDKATFDMLALGKTEGLFQLNGAAMTRHLMELKPTTIHDINAMVALYRPGPMKNIPEYIARKQGRSPIAYFHPRTEKFLSKSYGILVYQDDLLFTAMELAGYSWQTVDKFRKAVGKKIPAEMAKQHQIFVEGCRQHSGMSREEAENIWNLFEPFQGYGFNKAHAACYGRVAYQTAYMKANYPAEYMCAVLTAESGDAEKVAQIITECNRLNIPVLPPDINRSFKSFTVMKASKGQAHNDIDEIRFGLLTIKNVGENAIEALIKERDKSGPFSNIEDFVTRVMDKDLNKKSIESLIKAGAFDSIGDRATLLGNLDTILEYAREVHKSVSNGQMDLFDGVDESLAPKLRLADTDPIPQWRKLTWEKEMLGLFITGHPLDDFKENLNYGNGVMTIKELINKKKSSKTKIAGMVLKAQRVTTKTGKTMIFSTIEDMTSKIEVIVFPSVLEQNPEVFKENSVLVVSGRLSDREGIAKFMCDDVTSIASLV